MDEKELIYLAGFIDGEGCIGTVLIRGYGKRASNTTPRQQVRISATNANRKVLTDLQKAFGGNVAPHHKSTKGRKDCWRWTLSSRKASEAIALLLPYLRVKKRQAALCLEYQSTMSEPSIERTWVHGRITKNRVKLDIEVRRQSIVDKLNIANLRG